MKYDGYLKLKLEDLIPLETETESLNASGIRIQQVWGQQRYVAPVDIQPIGSVSKHLHLAGHRTLDQALLVQRLPTPTEKERLKHFLFESLPLERLPSERHGRLELQFRDQTRAELIMLQQTSLQGSLDISPSLLKTGLNGPNHVKWFAQYSRLGFVSETVRLMKTIRLQHTAIQRVFSAFAIEVLTVNVLVKTPQQTLEAAMQRVLVQMLEPSWYQNGLFDPVDDANNLLIPSPSFAVETDELHRLIRRMLEALEHDNVSYLFTGMATAPRPASNLGGQTLG